MPWKRTSLIFVAALLAVVFAQAQQGGKTQEDGTVNFTFDQVDVRTFVKIVGDMTGRRLVVDQNVEGKITVISPKIASKDVFPFFASILESVGASVVQEQGDVYRVVSIGPRTTKSAPVVGPDEQTPGEGIISKVIRLNYVNAGEIRKVLEPKVQGGKEGAIGAIESSNYLIITDTAANIARLERLVAEVDKPGVSRASEVITLKYAAAQDMADQLTRAMSGGTDPRVRRYSAPVAPGAASSDDTQPPVIVAAPHSNSILIVGNQAQLAELRKIIALMDVETPAGAGRLQAIFLQYIAAEDAAKSINNLIGKTTQAGPGGGVVKQPQTLSSGITVEPYAANNALLIDAMPKDFALISELVSKLDRMPEQVLVVVLIAEMSAGDNFNWSVDGLAMQSPAKIGQTVIQGSGTMRQDANVLMDAVQNSILPKGISVALAHGDTVASDGSVSFSYPALLNVDAYKEKGNFNVKANIPLWTQNNKEATASIVNNIPILKSTISGSGSTRDVIQNIDRLDVGIKLKVTPHINPAGEVMMMLSPRIDALVNPSSGSDSLAPTIASREITTTVTVPNGRTIILSGLIRSDRKKVERKVPILGYIPLIGWLFRHTEENEENTNLLVFVTPYVVKDFEAAQRLTDSWREITAIPATDVLGSSNRSSRAERDNDAK